MSNAKRLKPREPDEVEAAFAAELRRGCPHCGSRRVTGRFRAGVWDYRLSCTPSCRTFTEPQLAHRLAVEAAAKTAEKTGQRLSYRAIDSAGTRGAVVAGALAGGQ